MVGSLSMMLFFCPPYDDSVEVLLDFGNVWWIILGVSLLVYIILEVCIIRDARKDGDYTYGDFVVLNIVTLVYSSFVGFIVGALADSTKYFLDNKEFVIVIGSIIMFLIYKKILYNLAIKNYKRGKKR
jgi:hypothetical protein